MKENRDLSDYDGMCVESPDICRTCKYWDQKSEYITRRCNSDKLKNVTSPKLTPSGGLGSVEIDKSGISGSVIYTDQGFGCVNHEKK